MKHLKVSLFLLATLVAIGLSACKKMANTPPASTYVQFRYDSTTYVEFLKPVGTYATSNGEFQLLVNNSTSTFELFVNNLTAGTFTVASGQAEIIYASPATTGSGNLINVSSATSGTVVITAYSTTEVAGTISFSGKDVAGNTYTVTEGTFTTGYSKASTVDYLF